MSAKDRKNMDAPQEGMPLDGVSIGDGAVNAERNAPQEADDLQAIGEKIAEMEKEIASLREKQSEIIEATYRESVRNAKPVEHTKRSRDITKILREARQPGEDATRGQMRQMQEQMARLAQHQS